MTSTSATEPSSEAPLPSTDSSPESDVVVLRRFQTLNLQESSDQATITNNQRSDKNLPGQARDGEDVRPNKPFSKHASAGSVDSVLSAEASTFRPAGFPEPHTPLIVGNTTSSEEDFGEGPSTNVNRMRKVDSGGERNGEPTSSTHHQSTIDHLSYFSPRGEPIYFTTDPEHCRTDTHYLVLESIPRQLYDQILGYLSAACNWESRVLSQNVYELDSNHFKASLCFDDIRDLTRGIHDVTALPAKIKVRRGDWQEHYQTRAVFQFQNKCFRFDGQVHFDATYKGRDSQYSREGVLPAITEIALKYGEVYAIAEDPSNRNLSRKLRFRVEYFAISHAKKVACEMDDDHPSSIGDWDVVVHELSEPGKPLSNAAHRFISPSASDRPDNNFSPPQTMLVSPSGRSAWVRDGLGNTFIQPPPRTVPKAEIASGQAAMTPPQNASRRDYTNFRTPYQHPDGLEIGGGPMTGPLQSMFGHLHDTPTCDPFLPEGTMGEPQHILRWRIAKGLDVRTTIMVRNLPNHLTYRGLKDILDASSFGKYDFSYLRIDFAENKNVGYGFVNFVNPADLIEFIDTYGNKKWCPGVKDRLGRVRDARFSYATIQGYDCLVEKFRNSAVMDEFKDYRPKLWYTYGTATNDKLVGTEAPFPAANNLSKKQRSLDNASHLGLFASHRKNTGRRGRFSQFDRGTSAQIREDAYYTQTSPMNNASGFAYAHNNQYGYRHGPTGYGPPPPQFPQYGGFNPAFPPPHSAPMHSNFNGGPVGGYDPFVVNQYPPYSNGQFSRPPQSDMHGDSINGHRPHMSIMSSTMPMPSGYEVHPPYDNGMSASSFQGVHQSYANGNHSSQGSADLQNVFNPFQYANGQSGNHSGFGPEAGHGSHA